MIKGTYDWTFLMQLTITTLPISIYSTSTQRVFNAQVTKLCSKWTQRCEWHDFASKCCTIGVKTVWEEKDKHEWTDLTTNDHSYTFNQFWLESHFEHGGISSAAAINVVERRLRISTGPTVKTAVKAKGHCSEAPKQYEPLKNSTTAYEKEERNRFKADWLDLAENQQHCCIYLRENPKLSGISERKVKSAWKIRTHCRYGLRSMGRIREINNNEQKFKLQPNGDLSLKTWAIQSHKWRQTTLALHL